MHGFIISRIGYLENTVLQTYAVHISLYYFLKISFVNITTNLTMEVFKYSEAVKLMIVETISPKILIFT